MAPAPAWSCARCAAILEAVALGREAAQQGHSLGLDGWRVRPGPLLGRAWAALAAPVSRTGLPVNSTAQLPLVLLAVLAVLAV